MAKWKEVARFADLQDGQAIECVVDGHVVALFRVENELFAIDGICAHQGGPLAEGELTGTMITCPWHGWQYDVRTGQQQINASICQRRFPVRLQDDTIWIDVSQLSSR